MCEKVMLPAHEREKEGLGRKRKDQEKDMCLSVYYVYYVSIQCV